jgi:hypothetical protein
MANDGLTEHTETVTPQALPEQLLEQPGALDLYRIAVYALAGIGAAGLVGVLVLAGLGRAIPEAAIALAGVAVGALATMVAGGRQ